ncbi:hypothetical protein [Nitrosopumilus sp.]|uniref:hypothetical protein n=1 Tax=Nitrosopumilus sp. TaxID=2024843 RepID=UPI00247E4FE1|nr:hypothetical protein [Nitrosopumilus sp.]MCV0430472.1 hypothetical protein [Nitrosopumilus sp.]
MIDGKIISLALAITSGLVYTRVFENEFFKDIILVAIPAIIGLFAVKRVPNEWQQYRFKVALKKEIIDTFVKSVKKSFVVHDTAHIQLVQHYSVSEQPIDPTTGGVTHNVVFPTEPNEQPMMALKDEYNEFKNELKAIKLNGETLVSKMRLYFDSELVAEEFSKLNIQAGKCSQYIRQGFESKNKESFLMNLNAFSNEVKLWRDLSDKFENTLAKHKIKKISV